LGFAVPNIDNILDKLDDSKCFTALDLQSGFHQLRMKDYPDRVLNSRGEEVRGSDIHKTAFCTQYDTFEYGVMPFNLAGALSTYQRFVSFGTKDNSLFKHRLSPSMQWEYGKMSSYS
jgi:hypothetical protein